MGLDTETAFNAALQNEFPVVVTSQALRYHTAVTARATACRNSQLQSAHVQGSGTVHAAADHTWDVGQGEAAAANVSSSTVSTTTSTSSDSILVRVGGQHHASGEGVRGLDALLQQQQQSSRDEADSAEV